MILGREVLAGQGSIPLLDRSFIVLGEKMAENFRFRAKEAKRIRDSTKGLRVIPTSGARYPAQTYDVVDGQNRFILKHVLVEDIFRFDELKTTRGKALFLLRQREKEASKKAKRQKATSFFKQKEAVLLADIKEPPIYKLRLENNKVRILIPDKKKRLQKKYFDINLSQSQQKQYQRLKTDPARMKYLRRISKNVVVNQKTSIREGQLIKYKSSTSATNTGSVGVVITYELKKGFRTKTNEVFNTGRFQSNQHPNTKLGRQLAQEEAYTKLSKFLEQYDSNFNNLKTFKYVWRYKYVDFGART